MAGLLDLLAGYAPPSSPAQAPVDWRQLLTQLQAGPGSFAAPQAPAGMAMPQMNFNMQSPQYDRGSPMLSGGVSAPMFGGQLGVDGRYQAIQGGPPDWSAMMRYMSKF